MQPLNSIERAEAKLAAIRVEQRRQLGFLGERLGVIARLNDLRKAERYMVRRIATLKGEQS